MVLRVAVLALAVAAWLAFPALFCDRKRTSLVAAVSVVAMLPATFMTLLALAASPFDLDEPWPSPWIAFLLGDPPLALLAALTLVGAGVAGLVSRGAPRPTPADPVVATSVP